MKYSLQIFKLEGYENIKECYYYNSVENAIYTKEPRSSNVSVEKIETVVLKTKDNKNRRINLKKIKILFERRRGK